MNINKILIASGLCAMLLSTGCAAMPVTRNMSANDARVHTNVTRSHGGYGGRASYGTLRTHSRYGSPIGRGYNVRNSFLEPGSQINDNLISNYPRPVNINTTARQTRLNRSNLALVEVETDKTYENKETESKKTENNKTDNKKEKATGSAAKTHTTKATEKLHESSAKARRDAEHKIKKTKKANETKVKETTHKPSTAKTETTQTHRSHTALRSPRHSANLVPQTPRAPRISERVAFNRANYRPTRSNIERGINLETNHAYPRHNMYPRRTENRSFLRGHRIGNGYLRRNSRYANYGSQGYVRNYNNGFDGLIRDYRFGNSLGYRHNYAPRSHRYPVHYGYSHNRAISNAFTRGSNALRDGVYTNRANNYNAYGARLTRDYYGPMFGYGYNYESNITNHPPRMNPRGMNPRGHLNGQIVNVPYVSGLVAGS